MGTGLNSAMKILHLAGVVLACGFVSGCTVFEKELPVGDEVDFERHVKPILKARCLGCHNKRSMPGRTSFESRQDAFAPGSHGSAIIPGDPDNSRIVNFINAPRDTAEGMPREGHQVTAEEAETIREWIAAGADWPDGPEGRLSPKN